MVGLIIIGIVVITVVAVLIIRNKKSHKQEVIKEEVKVDHAPEARDVIFTSDKKEIRKITKEDLNYFDVDGDKIDGFVFYKTNKKVYLDKFLKRLYNEGDVLDENFEIYVRLNKDENFSFEYQVRANGKFSK